MTPAATAIPDAPPSDPIRATLEDAAVRDRLLAHARAILGKGRPGSAVTTRETMAEDAVQETCKRSLQLGDHFDASRANIGAWLHGILNNVLREMVRRSGPPPTRSPDTATALEVLASPDAGPAEEVANRLDAASYLMRLSVEHRTILSLRAEGLSHEEIAARLQISVGASRVRLTRAIRAAKDVVGPSQEEGGR
jgi:RNA polymerase sigma factor (sigma-70 family)